MKSVFGEYAVLTLRISGTDYEFYLPSEIFDRLLVLEDEDGLTIINNSGSSITLQGVPCFSNSDVREFYQITLPSSNLASNEYRYGGIYYLTTYEPNTGNTNVTSTNEYFSFPVSGSLVPADGSGARYVSESTFYSFTMTMLLFIVAMIMGLYYKWRMKLHD